ncbi:hypothetical protein Ocin01_14839 [Orchesella cincta]|uniref:Uncharacterized protein n=1 Tax=Orchesella cincta TaxID=48709 RepID=A0A1D2MFV4_ORCCI|nr:hypothetical protein Ocin01_14839 [Orchesella cincta]
MSAQLQGSPIDALIGCRTGEYKLRRDEYLIRMATGGENDNQSSDSSQSNEPYENMKVQPNGARVPLKEQQVMHLQMEINHPGGVRVILRKKDCLSSIAFRRLSRSCLGGWLEANAVSSAILRISCR